MGEVLRRQVSADIIYEIFLRLPPKSLLRFRAVSKNCRDIVDSLFFANMRMISIREAAAEEHQLLVPQCGEFGENGLHPYIYDGKEIRKSDHPIVEFSTMTDSGYAVETVAYGLLLFRHRYRAGEIFLYNPLRGELLELPRPVGARSTKEKLAVYGIGFDSTSHSYKIVRMCKNPMRIDNMLPGQKRFETEVYTLGTSSWRVICSSVCFPLMDEFGLHSWPSMIRGVRSRPSMIRGVSAYGDMHWNCWDSKNRNQRIISFDFKKEEFKDNPLPNITWQRRPCGKRAELIELNGLLAAFIFPIGGAWIDIWVMKDYEKCEWAREYRINTDQPFIAELTYNNGFGYRYNINLLKHLLNAEGLCGHGHGGVVFESLFSLSVYDLKTNRILGVEYPRNYSCISEKLSFVGNILCLRNFGYPIVEDSYKFGILKTRKVYVAA